jgi:hypothetical protein
LAAERIPETSPIVGVECAISLPPSRGLPPLEGEGEGSADLQNASAGFWESNRGIQERVDGKGQKMSEQEKQIEITPEDHLTNEIVTEWDAEGKESVKIMTTAEYIKLYGKRPGGKVRSIPFEVQS